MDALPSLSLLALRPLLTGDNAPGLAALTKLVEESSAALSRPLGEARRRAWKVLEVLVAGGSFWNGCKVFLAPEECRALRQQVHKLRQDMLPAEQADPEEFRRACRSELQAARRAGLLAGSGPDLAIVADQLAALALSPDAEHLSEPEGAVAQRLAAELGQAGFNVLAQLALPGPEQQVPILVAAARQALCQAIEAEPELARRLSWQQSGQPGPGGRRQGLALLLRTLALHGRGLQEWLDDGAVAPALPRTVHAHASPGQEPTAGEKATSTPGATGPREETTAGAAAIAGPPHDGAAPPESAEETTPRADAVSGWQRFWNWTLPLVVLTVPVGLVLWLLYRHAVPELRQFLGHKAAVICVAFSPDGKLALSGSGDKTVRLWDVETGQEVRRFEKHQGDVHGVAFAPDGKVAASGGLDTVRLWDVATAKELRRIDTPTNFILSVAFSPDGRRLLSTSKADHLVRIWDVAAGKQVGALVGHKGEVHGAVYSADGKRIVSGGDDTVRVWDAATGKEEQRFEGHTYPVTSVAFAPDGRFVLSGSLDGTARLWSLKTGKEVLALKGPGTAVLTVAFAPNGNSILTGSSLSPFRPVPGEAEAAPSPPRPLRLWSRLTGQETAFFEPAEGRPEEVWSVAFSPDGRYILSAGRERVVRLWEVP